MKLPSTVTASLFAIATVLSLSARAAADQAAEANTDVKTETAEPMKKMRPHSHLEEKVGVGANTKADRVDKAAKAADGKAVDAKPAKLAVKKINPANDMSKHFHPRDGGKN
ncbi:MAG: hypothetical protein Q8R69_17255 [Telluria sp.]|nr:hypothetical protein [Telluria sp.]